MQIYCLKNSYTDSRASAIIRTILDHCGFFYSWIEPEESPASGGLFLEYAPAEAQTGAPQFCLRIPALLPPARLNKRHAAWEEIKRNGETIPLLGGTRLQKKQSNLYGTDIVANIFYHLMRIEEEAFSHPEQMDPAGRDSILHQYGNNQIPLMDILSDHFARWLEQKARETGITLFKKAAWPGGESFAVALTHDVDFIRAFHPLKKEFLKLKTRLTRGLLPSIKKLEEQDQSHWGFDQLLSFYAEKNWTASFFFIAKYLEGRHFRYRIGSRKMKALIKELVRQKHEIALHPSRFSFEHPGRFKKEKLKLERVSGVTVKGMRQHYLRALFPAIWEHASALDLEYDTTLCLRRKSGFRSATSRPYFVCQNEKQLLVIPTIFFENTLPGEGADTQASLEEIGFLIKQVKQHGGLLTALWHTNHILQPAHYVDIWQGFLALLEQEAPWIAPLGAQNRWMRQRREIRLQPVSANKTNVFFPDDIGKFTLLLPEIPVRLDIDNPHISVQRRGRALSILNQNGQKSFTLNIGFQ